MTKITPSLVTLDPSLDKKHYYPLRSDITGNIDSKGTKRALSLNNILTPSKTIQEKQNEPRLYVRQKKVEKERRYQMKESARQKEEKKERRDQMKELDYYKLVTNHRVANNKIYDIKEEQENIKKGIPIFEKYFLDENIGPDTFVACMETNREI